MAANFHNVGKVILYKNFFDIRTTLHPPHRARTLFTSSSTSYSQYPPYYIQPVFKKEKIEDLEKSGEVKQITHVPIRAALSDNTCSVFHHDTARSFTNKIMKAGKRLLARDLLDKTFENIKRRQLERYHSMPPEEQTKFKMVSPADMLAAALENCRPIVELTPIKRGGVKYQVPIPTNDYRAQFLAYKWLLTSAQEKERNVHLPETLATEIMDAAANQGKAVKRKQDLHRQCEANRAYAHYRWS